MQKDKSKDFSHLKLRLWIGYRVESCPICWCHKVYATLHNYSASALLAVRTAVVARSFLSVRQSVCHSVTFRCFVQMNEDTIV